MYEYEISVRVIPDYDITATDVSEIEMEVESGQLYPDYSGPYSVDAAMYDQTLATHYKNMTGDIVVNAVVEVNGVVTLPTADGEANYIDINDKSGPVITQYHAKEDYSVGITPIQTGTGDPYPAGGGVNKFDEVLELGGISSATGQNMLSSTTLRSTNYCAIPVGGQIYLGDYKSGGLVYLFYYDSNKTYLASSGGWQTSGVKTPPTRACYFRLQLNTDYGTTYTNDISVNYPSTDHDYHPYSNIRPISGWTGAHIYVSPTLNQADATVYNIDWTDEAGTVYGGSLDVTLGKLRVTWAGVDMGNISWSYADSTGVFNTTFSNKELGTQNLLCSRYKVSAATGGIGNISDFEIRGQSLSRLLGFKDSTLAQEAGTKAELAGATLIYELATPLEYDLTPTEIQLLMGQNNIWADCGDITVTWGVQ